MILSLVFRYLYGNSSHEQPIDVVRVPHPSWIAVLRGIDNQSNGKVALSERFDGRLCDVRIGDAEHVDVKLLSLGVNRSLGASSIVVLRHVGGQKVHFRINWIRGIGARQSNAGSVCEISEACQRSVCPPVVVFGAKT